LFNNIASDNCRSGDRWLEWWLVRWQKIVVCSYEPWYGVEAELVAQGRCSGINRWSEW